VLRSVAVVAFIGLVATGALWAAQRKTFARGSVLAADIVAANQATVKAMTCDDNVEIGVEGAHFWCTAELRNGLVERIELTMDRTGTFRTTGH
jgi:hypothetical protein